MVPLFTPLPDVGPDPAQEQHCGPDVKLIQPHEIDCDSRALHGPGLPQWLLLPTAAFATREGGRMVSEPGGMAFLTISQRIFTAPYPTGHQEVGGGGGEREKTGHQKRLLGSLYHGPAAAGVHQTCSLAEVAQAHAATVGVATNSSCCQCAESWSR